MKKWMCCMTLVFAAALCLAGCGNEAQNPGMDVSDAVPDTESEPTTPSVIARPIINGLLTLKSESWKMACEGGHTYIERWPQGAFAAVSRIGNAQDPVIAPQHSGHDLDSASYAIDADYLCWLEWPGPPDAQDENWYLYLQKRDGGTPLLLDEGPYSYERGNVRGNWLSLDYEDGNVIWVKPYGDFQVKLYQSATGETTELDRSPRMGTQVAIGAEDAVWTKMDENYQVLLMHCDLASGAVTQLAQLEEGIQNPVICGHYLILHQAAGNELMVYYFDREEWTIQLGSHPLAFEKGYMFDRPVCVDDTHIALIAQQPVAPYQLSLLDLETGKVYRAESAPYTPLYVVPEDVDVETLETLDGVAVCRIQPADEDYGGTNAMMQLRLMEDGSILRMVQLYDFLW